MAGPQLALTPDLLEFAAAAESAISASALIIQRHTTYYRPPPGAASTAEQAAPLARCADARAGNQADGKSRPCWFPPTYVASLIRHGANANVSGGTMAPDMRDPVRIRLRSGP